jgi:hypothetical protein
VSIDYSKNCKIIIGPCEGSVFLRNCSSCSIAAACQQFRARECTELDLSLLVTTQPSIESSEGLKFGCWNINYPEFMKQLDKANLSIWNNDWSRVHNFTPGGRRHFSLIQEQESKLIDIQSDLRQKHQISLGFFPWTDKSKSSASSRVVVYLHPNDQVLIQWLKETNPTVYQTSLSVNGAGDAFLNTLADSRWKSAREAILVAIDMEVPQKQLESFQKQNPLCLVYVSSDKQAADADRACLFRL